MNAASFASLPRRAPFPLLALALCLAFAAVGVAVLDDYGIGADEIAHHRIAEANLNYILGDSDALPSRHSHIQKFVLRFYGVALDLPLLLVERALGLRDSRDILLMRHLLTHLLFLLGAFFCGLLAHRMFGSRALAALAMLLFLLHPRLHAHSFFNSKDPVFAALFMITLFLIHRAFRKGSLSAFALCGFGVGLAIDLRPFGLMLLPAVLAMRALDFWQAADKSERRRILATGGAFAAVTLATMYAVHPYYWANPLRFLDGIATLSQHPNPALNLFQGEVIRSDEAPPHYIPTWFAITAPPLTLLLGSIGAAAVCWQGVLRPGEILRNGALRFRLLLVGCATLPVVVAIALQFNIYNGWRQFYFLWAPFSLLAAAGLLALGTAGPRRLLAWGAAGAGLACVAVAMAWLHPHQQVYFNLLVDRCASGGLAQRYEMDYWQTSHRQALEHLRARRPDAMLHVLGLRGSQRGNRRILPALDRRHIPRLPPQQADYYIGDPLGMRMRWMPATPVVHLFRAYGDAYPYLAVVAPRLIWGALRPDVETYRAAHRALASSGGPAARGVFDIHFSDSDDALYYVKEDCGPADAEARFFLHFFPADAKDLPLHRRKYGFDNRDFDFGWRGAHFDGKCMTKEPLPGYPITRIRTGQYVSGEGQLWKAEIPLP